MQAKMAFQTEKIWEATPVHYVKRVSSLPRVIQTVSKELKRVFAANSVSLSIDCDSEVIGRGFVSNITSRPVIDLAVRLPSSGKAATVLFLGRPPRELLVDGVLTTVALDDMPNLSSIKHQSSVLEVILSLIADIKVHAFIHTRYIFDSESCF